MLPHAPPEAMQFGGALKGIPHDMRHANPTYGPVHLSKYDIKDGYKYKYLSMMLIYFVPQEDVDCGVSRITNLPGF
jgi:hypothetical protein